ncbi:MAG TPA: hypothetical protein VII12_07265 [Thermoanaerobaculia bacterium]
MRRIAVIIAVAASLALAARAQRLESRRTRDLDLVYYDKAHEYLSYHLTRSFENSLAFDRKLFDYTPSEPIMILMQDFGDYGHGGTSTVPWNYISIGIEPFDYVYDVMPANERMNWLMHHELVHVVATDKAADSDLKFRRLFHGKVAPIKEEPLSMLYSYLASPRWYSPRWYHEGIAVFLETWMAGGVGRALGGYDEMVFRTMVRDNAFFYDIVGLESEGTTIDFQIGQNSYLYGTRFMSYLAMKYSPEKVIKWVNRSPGSKRYFASQFEKVFGTPLDDEWKRWIAWEHEWQKGNLARIRQYPVTAETRINREILGSVSRSFYDPDRKLLYAAINRPAKPAQIVAINVQTGEMTKLTDVVAPALYFVTSMAYDARGRKIFYTTNNSRGWRDLNELDLNNGRRRRLLKNCRTGDLVVNPADQSIWGIQHHNGRSTLVVIPPPYDKWRSLLTLDYGRDIFDLDISPDGKTLSAAMIDVTGAQQLVKADVDALLHGKSSVDILHEFENNSPSNFVFSPDGRYLYGTSYYTGVSNVWRYDLQKKKMEAMTNVETGLFRPIPISDDTIVAYHYTAKGFAPVRFPIEVRQDINAIQYLGQQVVEKHPIVKEWNAGSPARINLDQVTTYAGPYHPLARVRLGSIYPVVEGYKNKIAAGLRFNASDPLGLRAFDFTAAYSPDRSLAHDEKLHLKLGYDGVPWKVRLGYNATDFYDLFGPTRVSRKGRAASVSYHQYLIFERPRTFEYTISSAYYGGLDTLPDYQNVRAPFSQYETISGRLDYRDLRKTIGAVDDEYGFQWTATTSGNHAGGRFFPRFYGTYDRGFLLPMDHASLWVRSSAGKSFGDRDNPFANFFFGAFGNNWIDYQEVRRYHEYYSFPGLELNEAGGNDFGKVTLEWTLPPLRFRHAGVPSFYTNWARLALFTSGLMTDVGKSDFRRTIYDVGAQVDFSMVLFSNLESTFSVGYATAIEKGRSSNEVMVSLKLLR